MSESLSRKAFEAWAVAHRYPVSKTRGVYAAKLTQQMWECWKAASIHWAAWILMTSRDPKVAHKAREVIGENDEHE